MSEAAALIVFFAYCVLVMTGIATVLTVSAEPVDFAKSFASLGRQVAVDAVWLVPTLIATLVLLIGVPLAQARSATDDVALIRRRVAVCSYAIAGVAVAAIVLAAVGSIGDAATAERMWSVAIVSAVAVAISLWTGGLVFGTLRERLRAATNGVSTTQAAYVALRSAGAGQQGLRGTVLFRILLLVGLAVTGVSTVAALVGAREAVTSLVTAIAIFALVLASVSVPLSLAFVGSFMLTDASSPRFLRWALGGMALLSASSVGFTVLSTGIRTGIPLSIVASLVLAQLLPVLWAIIPSCWGSWTLLQLVRGWRMRRIRLRRLAYRQEVVDLQRRTATGE
ncbi:hypothetical protein [Frondihabitans sp. PhB153]|uniref:hypothetical protein n=1 Tax=Frondihabitans sp. PhB153 TaxID=2485191 RepID=UPI000F516FD6|nr:hypothetical protein [Frondihabitans sp. PhB153]